MMSLRFPIPRTTTKLSTTTFVCIQCRHATLLRRPKRPYTFTQLVTLSDGSTFTHRTTSPQSVYRSTRDTRNAPLWNPSSERLLNVEEDEAGRLAAFRSRFGRGWDAANTVPANIASEVDEDDDNLLDLISSFGQEDMQPSSGNKGGRK